MVIYCHWNNKKTKRKGLGNEIETIMYISGLLLIKGKEPKQGSLYKLENNSWSTSQIMNISERIMKVQIYLYGRETVLIATYAPTDDSAINIKDLKIKVNLYREDLV